MIVTVDKPLSVVSSNGDIDRGLQTQYDADTTTYRWKMDVTLRQLPDLAGKMGDFAVFHDKVG